MILTLKIIFLNFLQGDIGPLNASLPTEVPLWVAIFLKQRRKCRIQAPEWMDVGKITLAVQITKIPIGSHTGT